MAIDIRRREVIAALGGAMVAWPLAALVQQGERVRRIGVLMTVKVDDPDQQNGVAAFVQVLQQLGWTDGRNVRIDTRWAGGEASAIRRHADDLVALAPDDIAAAGNAAMAILANEAAGHVRSLT
jgi:putative tryptophan/tyrosine transport system substrate-binding protein